MKNPHNQCNPNKKMSSTNFADAKKECARLLSCHMFYDYRKNGRDFYACENTASVTYTSNSNLYVQVGSGNENICGIDILEIFLFSQGCKNFYLFIQVMSITWLVWDLNALYLILCQTWKTVKLLQLN